MSEFARVVEGVFKEICAEDSGMREARDLQAKILQAHRASVSRHVAEEVEKAVKKFRSRAGDKLNSIQHPECASVIRALPLAPEHGEDGEKEKT